MKDLPVTKMRVKIPTDLSSEEKRKVAEMVMDHIRKRTEQGLDAQNRKWKGEAGKYTDQYAKKKGVSTGGPVDLTLSSSMLASMRYFSSLSKSGSLIIGYKKGTKDERKAEGNILGSYGREPQKNPKKARPFLEMKQSDVDMIVDVVRGE